MVVGGQRNEDGIFKKKMYLSKLIPEFFHGFVKIFVRITLSYTWICQNCYMDFSKLLNGFVKIDQWRYLNCYMNL